MWTERLAPYNAPDRDLLVDEIFFAVLALTLMHGILRRTNKAWVDQFAVAGVLCLLLPTTGWLVNRDLLETLSDQDRIRSGVVLTAIGVGIGFLVLAIYLHKRLTSTSVPMIVDPKLA